MTISSAGLFWTTRDPVIYGSLDELLAEAELVNEPVTAHHARLARHANTDVDRAAAIVPGSTDPEPLVISLWPTGLGDGLPDPYVVDEHVGRIRSRSGIATA